MEAEPGKYVSFITNLKRAVKAKLDDLASDGNTEARAAINFARNNSLLEIQHFLNSLPTRG